MSKSEPLPTLVPQNGFHKNDNRAINKNFNIIEKLDAEFGTGPDSIKDFYVPEKTVFSLQEKVIAEEVTSTMFGL